MRKFFCCSVSVKCYIFKIYCSTLYCAPMCFNCTKMALKKLIVAYNNSLRRFIKLPWRNSTSEMFANLNISSFDEMLRIFIFRFLSRVIASNNVLISSIYYSPCHLYSNIWTSKNSILHSNRANL